MMWGRLVPLSPFPNEGGDDDAARRGSALTLTPLEIPGSFGREDLLRPLSRACPVCRKRRWKAGIAASPKAKEGGGPKLCDVCRSIQAVSKFIPRKDFWAFSRNNSGGKDGLLLSVPKTASRLVHVRSSAGDLRSFNDTPKGDGQSVAMADGDVVSLLWSGGATYSSSNLKPLARFRVVKRSGEDTAPNELGKDSAGDGVDDSLLKGPERGAKKNEDTKDEAEPNHIADKDEAAQQHATNAADGDTGGKGVAVPTPQKTSGDSNDDSSSSASSDDEHLWNAGGFLRAQKKEEKVARGNYFRDVRAKYGDDRPVGEKRQRLSQSQGSSNRPSQQLAKGKEDAGAGSIGGGSKTEEESESAPLTLPSQFLASYSKSFDSTEKSPSQPAKGSERSKAQTNLGTPQKDNQSCKRTRDEIEPTDEVKEASKTPKKSNVSSATANNNASVPISSLHYDKLIQLRKESAPSAAKNRPSVRHSVLSLTVALTSNASSWDADFTRECNAEGEAKGGAKPDEEKEKVARRNAGQRWMPRLLRGTQVKAIHGEPAKQP